MNSNKLTAVLRGSAWQFGSTSATLTEGIENMFAAHENVMRNFGWIELVREIVAGATRFMAPEPVNLQAVDRNKLMTAAITAAIGRLWRRSKIVYSMHPDMVNELADCGSTQLPSEIFRTLPHTNPLIVFPRPLPTSSPDGKDGFLVGIHVYGHAADLHSLCSTHDDHRKGLGLMFVVAVTQADGSHELAASRVVIPTDQDTFSVDEVVKFNMDAGWAEYTKLRATEESPGQEYRYLNPAWMGNPGQAWLSDLLRTAVNTLLYVCTNDPDFTAEKAPTTKKKRSGKKQSGTRDKPVSEFRVGWRLGPALGERRRRGREKNTTAAAARTGRQLPAHQRRCHYKVVWTGPGRSVPELRFIKPYWVNLSLLTTEPSGYTIVPVRSR